MTRRARVILPNIPQHIIQRGNYVFLKNGLNDKVLTKVFLLIILAEAIALTYTLYSV
jgi:hypothetical protein